MVGYPAEVEEVVLGAASGRRRRQRSRPGGLLVDMTTSRPALAVEIAARAGDAGLAALDAPVSGGDVGARNGTLSIMVGGDADAFARASARCSSGWAARSCTRARRVRASTPS